MLHLRSDWDGIQDTYQETRRVSSSIEADEPVFLLRAKDPASSACVMSWANLVELQGGDPELVKQVRLWASEMTKWRQEHHPAPKVADVPEGRLRSLA